MKKLLFFACAIVVAFCLFVHNDNAYALSMPPIKIADGYGNYYAESKFSGFQELIDDWGYAHKETLPDLPDDYDKFEGTELPTTETKGTISTIGAVYLALKGGRDSQFWYVEGLDEFEFELKGGLSNYITFGTPVPEPTTVLLLGIGLIGTVAYGRRRHRLR